MVVNWKAVAKNLRNGLEYQEWLMTVVKITLPIGSLNSLSKEYVNNVYRGINAKNCFRDKRG